MHDESSSHLGYCPGAARLERVDDGHVSVQGDDGQSEDAHIDRELQYKGRDGAQHLQENKNLTSHHQEHGPETCASRCIATQDVALFCGESRKLSCPERKLQHKPMIPPTLCIPLIGSQGMKTD